VRRGARSIDACVVASFLEARYGPSGELGASFRVGVKNGRQTKLRLRRPNDGYWFDSLTSSVLCRHFTTVER